MKGERTDLIFKDECYRIIGACFAVYRDKGCGFLEPLYQECLEIEFELSEIPAVAKPRLALSYRGRPLKQHYEPDCLLRPDHCRDQSRVRALR